MVNCVGKTAVHGVGASGWWTGERLSVTVFQTLGAKCGSFLMCVWGIRPPVTKS